jgi:preprotein translocase subunit SecA
MVSSAIENAQSKIEGFNFDLRKHILEYDDVMNKHREVIYKKRKEFLTIEDWKPEIENWLHTAEEKKALEEKIKELGDKFNQVAKVVALRILDMFWLEHLENMEYLRDSVRLRAYGQKDPLVEYKSEGHKMFKGMLEQIQDGIGHTILSVGISKAPVQPQMVQQSAQSKDKVGRNNPCPCGKKDPLTGRPIKYKKCCYPKFG